MSLASEKLANIEEQLVELNNGTLTVTGRLIDASNATLYAICSVRRADPTVDIPCIYKPIAGERPLWDFAEGNLASREYGSYLISELLGWNLIPVTILRD